MGATKEKRIKKLKKLQIWPAIVGLILLMIVSSALIGLTAIFSITDIAQRKVVQAGAQAVRIAALYDQEGIEKLLDANETVFSYVELIPEIETVSVMSKSGQKVWSNNKTYPVMDNAMVLDLQTVGINQNVSMFIEEEMNQLITIHDGKIVLDGDSVTDTLHNIIGSVKKFLNSQGDDFDFFEENTSIVSMKIWFAVTGLRYDVYLLNDIHVYLNDLLMLAAVCILFTIIVAVFVLYYIISFISFLANSRKMTKVMYTDVVTGGNNKLYFAKKGAVLLKKNRWGRLNYAMLHLQMRKYRSFCTCFGVQRGEELIEAFYSELKKSLNAKELLAHRQNAEFAVLLTYINREELLARIEQMESQLNAILPKVKLYFDAGVYEILSGETDIEQLYNNALIACEFLKDEAENKIAVYDIEMNKRKLWERKVEDDMDRALMNREFKVYLQPKVSSAEETLAGAEALVRWIHPEEGFIPPNRFIPIFEQNGFIVKLDDYMLEEVSRLQAQWLSEGKKTVPISVNVSRTHFTREDLAEHICRIVDKYEVPHHLIELELTESAFFDDKHMILNTVHKMQELGFVVSMDDFGSGYSSLNSLKELHLDVLKIDGEFFRGLDAESFREHNNIEERGLLIVAEVIDLAKKLNMQIVAEGIESREQVDFLVSQECDLIQGYFFAKPMPVEEYVEKYCG